MGAITSVMSLALVQKHTGIKIYRTLPRPTEAAVYRKWNDKRNQEIMYELNTDCVLENTHKDRPQQSAVVYWASGKKMARGRNRPHGPADVWKKMRTKTKKKKNLNSCIAHPA